MRLFGGSGLPFSLQGEPTNYLTLEPGAVYYPGGFITPSQPGSGTANAGWFYLKPGRYTNVQALDPIANIWRNVGDDSNAARWQYVDGFNIRLANQTGCAVGATVTTAGSAYTTAPTVVASAGGSVWRAILGPLVSTTTTITYGGTSYTYPPQVVIQAPPVGGLQATGYATLSAGVVSTVTITNQGAGYSSGVPALYFVNDPRDTTGSGAAGTLTLTGSGTVAAVVCVDHGNPITSGTVPTLTFGSGSAAATVLMNWGIQTYAVTTAGAGYGTSAFIGMTAIGPALVGSPSYTNPDFQDNVVRVRNANIWVPTNSSGGLVTGGVIVDGGVYRGTPTLVFQTALAAASTVGALTLTMGGFNDTCLVEPT